MLRPFNVRNFNLLFGGQAISIIGDALYMVALPWLVLTTGGNAQELGIILSAYGLPRAFSMLAGGWLSDRLRPRRLMLITDTIRMVLVGLLAALALQGHPAFWQLCVIAVLLGIFGGAFTPAAMSILPDTLDSEELQAGNGLMMSSMQGANLLGSAFAGVIVATFSAGAGMAIDAATFLVSALSLALMRGTSHAAARASTEGQARQEDEAEIQGEQISIGRFLLSSRLIQLVLLIFVVISLFSGGIIEVALPTLVKGPMHGGANAFGFILAGWGAGALLGSVFAGMLGKNKYKGWLTLLGGLIVSAALGLLPTWGVIGAVICMFIGGVANSGVTVLLFTAIQLAIPRHLMGRVMGLVMFSSFGLYPVSTFLMGLLAVHFGPALLFPICGVALTLVMLFGMTQKALREI
jgi:MFS family permease